MTDRKLKLFAAITFSGSIIFTVLYVLCISIEGIFYGYRHFDFDLKSGGIFVSGIFIGLVHALLLTVLNQYKKTDLLKQTILFIFAVNELILTFVFAGWCIYLAEFRFDGTILEYIYQFITFSVKMFVKDSLFMLLFSIIAGISYSKLFAPIKCKIIMP